MKVLVLGANGKLGQFVVEDLLKTKVNKITTLTRKPFTVAGTTNIVGTPLNLNDVEKAARGMNVIISALGAPSVEDFDKLVANVAKIAVENKALLIWSGGAGTLIEKDGKQLIDYPDSFWTPDKDFLRVQVIGQAHAMDYLAKVKGLTYAYLSPSLDLDYERDEKPFKIEATDKVLYNKQDKSIEGYRTQAKALVSLIDHHDGFLNKRTTIVEK